MNDYLMSSEHEGNLILCGIAPRISLTTLTDWDCWNCGQKRVVRKFSGSGWYEDSALCVSCGEDVSTGYRPFKPRWRKENIAKAEHWLATAIPPPNYAENTFALIKAEMGWEK